MCGRKIAPGKWAEHWRALKALPPLEELHTRYNVAPSQDSVVVTELEVPSTFMAWGFQPAWAQKKAGMKAQINARCETAGEKPYFRSAYRKHRCLIPALGWYEWKRDAGKKQPYAILRADREPFMLGGIWDPASGYAVLTTDADPTIAHIHDRMPIIIPPEAFADWLHPEGADAIDIHAPQGLTSYAVSTYVNNVRNDSPECLAPLEDRDAPPLFPEA